MPAYFEISSEFAHENVDLAKSLINSMTVHDNFLNETEEKSILDEIEPYMKRLHYEFDHWDDVGVYNKNFSEYYFVYFRLYMGIGKRNG